LLSWQHDPENSEHEFNQKHKLQMNQKVKYIAWTGTSILYDENGLNYIQLPNPVKDYISPRLYMHEKVDAHTVVFAAKSCLKISMITDETLDQQKLQIKQRMDRIEFIPKLLIQLKTALQNNAIALKEAEDEKELTDVGALYLEGKRITSEIESVTNELKQLESNYYDLDFNVSVSPVETKSVRPHIHLKVGLNEVYGTLVQVIEAPNIHSTTFKI
jgi:hypothetical protein